MDSDYDKSMKRKESTQTYFFAERRILFVKYQKTVIQMMIIVGGKESIQSMLATCRCQSFLRPSLYRLDASEA